MTFGELRFRIQRDMPGMDPDRLDGAINARVQSICNYHRWKALETDSAFFTVGAYQVGTVSLTQGSAVVTGLLTTFLGSHTGMQFNVQGQNETYSFTFLDGSTGALDRPYEDFTILSAGYSLWQSLYALPADYKEPRDAHNERIPQEIKYFDRTQLNLSAPARVILGEPQFWSEASSLIDASGSITRYAELYPVPKIAARYPFRYIALIPRLRDEDTGYQLPSWISDLALIESVEADLSAAGSKEQAAHLGNFEREMRSMLRQDGVRRGPQRMRMADKFTNYRIDRQFNPLRRTLP